MSIKPWILFLLFAGCTTTLDDEELSNLSDYPSWPSFEVRGTLSAHGDTIRVIYANDLAREWSGAGEYPIGSVIVKEIYERSGDERGALDYLAVMRKLEEAPGEGSLQEGWLFTMLDAPDAAEEHNLRCYRKCHAAAPYDSSFHDFGD